jgi:hypothetical protein
MKTGRTKKLVLSYDLDDQRWFYDVVFATNRDDARNVVLKARDYCIDADVFSVPEWRASFKALTSTTKQQADERLRESRAE